MDERIIGKWEKEEFGEIINIISINPPKMKMSIRVTGYFNIEPNCAYEKDGYFCYEINDINNRMVYHVKYIDGKKVDIPSYLCKPGQTIALKEASRNLVIVKEALENTVARLAFLSYDENTGVGTFVRYPERSEVLPEIRENLIVEFYNK